jgi:class 3 adenylate cyclase/tetratricopeptide (TPR) repeat protein/tRNA A-37 threonylcarbamoyl transferase component Bud32
MTFPVLTNYRILGKLGQGGMGEVYLALDTRLNRKVALKFLSKDLRDDPSARKRLLREAQSAATLDHPFICKIYEASEDQGELFIAMEYVEGDTLQKRLAAGPLPLKDLLGVATEITEALEVAHSHAIVHRDLKPANIMLGRGGHIKVMDFGLAKQVKPIAAADDATVTASLLTEAGMVVGTLDYASPEQLRGGEGVDARSDIFSLGAILCEAISGRNPLRKSSPMETVSATLSSASVSLPQLEAAPSFLNHIVRKMLEKNPDDRYQSVKDLMADLRLVRADSVSGPGRRLAAIMFTDMVSYSAIAGQNEALAMELLHEHRRLLRPVFARHNGQEIKTVGDAFLVEFMSAVQATECAADIQELLSERNASVEQDRRIQVRIGLHLGDVIHEQNDVFGDGVNIASRIEPFAEPGGICLSEDVANQIRNKVRFPVVRLAESPQLKGIDRPVQIYRVVLPWEEQLPVAEGTAASAAAEVAPAPGVVPERKTGLRRFVPRSRALAVSSFSIITVTAVVAVVLWIGGRKPVLSFAPREWVLIGDFENQTGEAIFDQSLETALTVSMQQSQYANVLPRSRITTALRRMKKPAADQDEVLPRLDALAASIRRDLGESLASVQQSSKELRMVTTPSLEALKLFSDGVARWGRGDYDTAIQLYESAVKIDPDFAKAHAGLGICYCSFVFNDRVKGKEHLDKALRLSDRVTERERQQIQIQYEDNLGSKQNALGLYRVYLQAYPDDTGYRYNYANALRDEGQTQEAAAQYEEVLRLDMNSASAYINLAVCYRTLKKYPEALASYGRAFALEPTWMTQGNLNHEYGFALVLSGDVQAARDVFTKALPTSRPGVLRSLAMLDLYQGKYGSAARQLSEALLLNIAAKNAFSEARNHLYLSIVFEGQRKDAAPLFELDKATKNLEAPPPQVWLASRVGVGYARAGAMAKARAVLDKIHKDAEMQIAQQSSDVHRLEGELLLAQGDRSRGVEKLLVADRERQSPLTIESLARAYRVTGDNGAAIAQYEQLIAQDEGSVGWEPQQEWLMSHYHLAKLYQAVGQKDKARPLVDRLLQLWKEADPDLPPLKDFVRLKTELGG